MPDRPAKAEYPIDIPIVLLARMVSKAKQVFLPGTDAAAACSLKVLTRSAEEECQPGAPE